MVQTNLSGRTLEEQVKLRINSRVSRMRDRGYKDTVEDAIKNPGNQLGLERPMLAHPIERIPNVNYQGSVLQKKLDGHRCLITCQDGELIPYSRQGKRIDSIHHIIRGLEGRIPEGTTIDGELYCHGQSLQTLASWIKRDQPNTRQLYFVGYDLISNERYTDRHRELSGMLRDVTTDAPGKVVVLPFCEYTDDAQQAAYFREVRAAGFEGLMLRLDRRGYEAGKRSSGLLKIKEFFDDEFEVIDIVPSKDGWGICVCRARNGSTFSCSAPGDMAAKKHVLINKSLFIGRKLTVEYSFLTADGIPFHPNATRWLVTI
jgi:DNA ligase 1